MTVLKTDSLRKTRGDKPHFRKRSARKSTRCANYLPDHIGPAFQKELIELVDELSVTEGFKGAYLQSELLAKYCDTSTTPADVRFEAALSKWLRIEKHNSNANMRIQLGDVCFGNVTTSDELIALARNDIAKVLGDFQGSAHLVDSCHSNGASTRVKRSVFAAALKCSGIAHVSDEARPHWLEVATNTQLENQTVSTQQESVFFTVPKNADIDRVACKEPEINMFLQRAVGSHIRNRLLKFGINLRDQTINQKLARTALADGLATIDLSAASDSITRQLVFELLPIEWYFLLDDLRVKEVKLPDGSIHTLEMFSSMGNGFTFELESLIFWALTRAVATKLGTKGRISVYGDDIICSSKTAPFLAQVFGWFGFKVNSKKSNWTGSFRESCGKHYDHSWDVTPFYIREPVKTKTDIIRLLNRLLAWDGRGFGLIMNQSVLSFHMKWAKAIPSTLWGGVDPERIDSLVTGHRPRSRLLRKTREQRRPESGALTHWFTVKEGNGNSRLSYDIVDQWAYPSREEPMMARETGHNPLWVSSETIKGMCEPFSVDNKVPTRYEIASYPTLKVKGVAGSYCESTAWSPWLIHEGSTEPTYSLTA